MLKVGIGPSSSRTVGPISQGRHRGTDGPAR
ncbi:serine dehydratase beta chain [Streptomyces decoyicus]